MGTQQRKQRIITNKQHYKPKKLCKNRCMYSARVFLLE